MDANKWEIGQRVKYKLPNGDRICLVKKSSLSIGGHYVELLDEKTGETLYSAWDKNLVNLEKSCPNYKKKKNGKKK